MGHFNTTFMTSGPVPAIHAGLNTQVVEYTLSETASGSLTIALTPLPAGTRVTNVQYYQDLTDPWGSGGETLTIYNTIGGTTDKTFIGTATQATTVRCDGTGMGERITASSNLVIAFQGVVNTGTSATAIKVICQYLTQDDGD